jgi:hypothetical protein
VVASTPSFQSGSSSDTSQQTSVSQPISDLLSPAHAQEPNVLFDASRERNTNAVSALPSAPESSTDNANKMIFSGGQLPPGFIPTGFTPVVSGNHLQSGLGQSTLVPGQYHDVRFQSVGIEPSNDIVIPDPRLYENDLDSNSDDAISSGMSTSDGSRLTTPSRLSRTQHEHR